MLIFPAIDILDGRAVRLKFGKRNLCDVYGSPVDFAHKWLDSGARYLHIVDLNAAFDGNFVNDGVLKELGKITGATLQIGGGNRTVERIEKLIEEYGFERVIIGSACVTNPELVSEACEKYGDKIVAGLDAEDNRLKIKGWVAESDKTPLEVARKLGNFGVTDVVFTDISRDGVLSGVNYESTLALQELSGMNVIASGGVATMDDIRTLKDNGAYGAILGRSLYEGTVDLAEAVAYAH